MGPVLVPVLASAVTTSSFTLALTAACDHGALAGKGYASMLITDGFDNPEALAAIDLEDLMSAGISRGHAKSLLRRFFEPVVGLFMNPHEGGRADQSLTTPERLPSSEPETEDENQESVELELELEFEREICQLLSPLRSPGLCAESDEPAATAAEIAGESTEEASGEIGINQPPASPILPCEIPPTRFMPSCRLTPDQIHAAVGALEAEGFTVVVDLANREDRQELTAVYHDRLYCPPSKEQAERERGCWEANKVKEAADHALRVANKAQGEKTAEGEEMVAAADEMEKKGQGIIERTDAQASAL